MVKTKGGGGFMNNVKKKLQKWYRVVSLSLNELVTGRRILGGDYLSQKWKQPIGEHTKWKKFHFSYREMRYRQTQIVSFYKLCIFLLHYFPLHWPAIEFAKYIFSTASLKDKQGQAIFFLYFSSSFYFCKSFFRAWLGQIVKVAIGNERN